MFEIDESMDSALMGLAWLVGRWEGMGNGTWPDRGDFTYGCQIDFAHNGGPYLHYLMQLSELNDELVPIRSIGMETGFWRPLAGSETEVVLTNPDGLAEVWFGQVTGAKIELTTDAVARTQTASVPVTGGHRLYGNVEGDLMFTYDRATTEHELQNYLWARLVRTA